MEVYRHVRFQKTNLRGAEGFYTIPQWRLVAAIKNLVDKEGPIHRDVVKKRITQLLNVKMGKKITRVLDFAISSAQAKGEIKIDGFFLWPSSMKYATLRIHQKGLPTRSINEIPPQELSLALIECVKNSISISEEDLVKETARIFGLRATKRVSGEINILLHSLLSRNFLRKNAGKIMAGDSS